MQQTIRDRILPALWPALIGALLALGLMLPILSALDMTGTSTGVWACVLAAACCVVMGMGGRFRLIGLGLAGGLLAFLLVSTGALGNLGGMLGAVYNAIRGNSAPLKMYGPEVALIAGFALTLAGWAMARQSAGFYPAMSLTMIVLLVIWFSGRTDALWLFTPALIALCAMFARSSIEGTPMVRTLLASALAVLLALMISPSLQIRSESMESFADSLRTYITDSLFFTEPRSVYSISVDGYKPLESRLGGPVNVDEQPVMTVETPTSVLLRGTIYNYYSGLNWSDRLAARRYLLSDPRNRAARVEALDEQRPAESLRESDLFRLADINITMQVNSASTLFVAQRAQDLETPMALVPYFNQSGELFITRNLEAGDTYSFKAPIINAGDSRVESMIAQAAMSGGENRDMSDYLQLSEAIASDVYALTNQITLTSGSPYEIARAIQTYLQKNFRYTTSPDVPPDNQDFVSYFLLTGKEGYCTYFASAMAIMGRIAGLPTRYVEGYLAEPSGGVSLVTSKQAHAWTEVYFDGFGWVAFDATPPQSMGGPRRDGTGGGYEDWQEQDENDGGESPDATPSPSPAPDSPEGDGGDMDPDEDDPDGGDGEPDPTPTPRPTPTPTPPPDEEPPENPEEPPPDDQEDTTQDQPNKRNYGWLWVLLILVVIGLLVWRALWTSPRAIVERHTGDTAKLLAWYRALLGLLAASGMPARAYETPQVYAARIEQGIPKEAGFSAVANSITRMGYGRRTVEPEEVETAAACYRAVWHAAPLKGKVLWFIRRMVRGVGSVRQVP